MGIGERIQSLRKTKGMSQEELANQIGVSRQAISKWESEQSTPDIDKVILLSELFNVTTDYLLKGIETQKQTNQNKNRVDARIFSTNGTVCNFIGLIVAMAIWIEKQVASSVAIGMIFLAIGTMLHFMGQYIGYNRHIASKWFWIINIWIIVLMPLSCMFNFAQGVLGGFGWYISPIPQMGNSYTLYVLFWLFYFIICTMTGILLFKKRDAQIH